MKLTRHFHPASRSLFAAFPRHPWGGFEAEVERMLDTTFGNAAGLAAGGYFPVDIYEDKENTYIRAALPGVAKEAIGVEVADGVLNITASRKTKNEDGEQAFEFKRAIAVPDGANVEKINARYENGELTVTLPKQETVKPRTVNVAVN